MGKRGPKPVDIGLLSNWEFKFYKAFHLLRDGTPLPVKYASSTGLTKRELRSFVAQLKRMSPEQYLLATRRLAAEMGEKVNLTRPPNWVERWSAEQERDQEIHWMERALNPPRAEAEAKRRKIWIALVEASTFAALRKASGRRAQLPDGRRRGMAPFPRDILQHAAQVLSMKRNKRFPRSSYGDNARLEYLARGMAGVLCGVSPMTSIARLRNMKHGPGGPLWVTRHANDVLRDSEQYCRCWRCSIEKSNKVGRITHTWYENGLRLFLERAVTTKTPRQWSELKSRNISRSQ